MTTKRKEKSTNNGKNVARIRALIDLDKAELAQKTGLSMENIAQLEKTMDIPDETLALLARGLGVPVALIRNFDGEAAVFNFLGNITIHDHGVNHLNYRPTFNYEPADKIIDLFERWMATMAGKMEHINKNQ